MLGGGKENIPLADGVAVDVIRKGRFCCTS